MYALLLFLLPLSVPACAAWFPKGDSRPFRLAVRGSIMAIPSVLVWLILKSLHQPSWGSALLILTVFARYLLIPAGLFVGSFVLSSGLRNVERGIGFKDLLYYSLGFFAVFNIIFAVSLWGERYYAYTLVLPIMMGATALALPPLMENAVRYGMPDGIRWILAAIAGLVLAATAFSLLFLRLEWLGIILCLAYSAGAGSLGLIRLAHSR
jgi:hypothetical protein